MLLANNATNVWHYIIFLDLLLVTRTIKGTNRQVAEVEAMVEEVELFKFEESTVTGQVYMASRETSYLVNERPILTALLIAVWSESGTWIKLLSAFKNAEQEKALMRQTNPLSMFWGKSK